MLFASSATTGGLDAASGRGRSRHAFDHRVGPRRQPRALRADGSARRRISAKAATWSTPSEARCAPFHSTFRGWRREGQQVVVQPRLLAKESGAAGSISMDGTLAYVEAPDTRDLRDQHAGSVESAGSRGTAGCARAPSPPARVAGRREWRWPSTTRARRFGCGIFGVGTLRR